MKKIMFNNKYGLTKAVLERRKTHTRRLVPESLFTLQWDVRENTLVFENSMGDFIDIRHSRYAQYKAGEIVAVAQAYNDFFNDEYDPTKFPDGEGWNNKMFVKAELMPHHIRITNVRVERLQDISDEDCLREGIEERRDPYLKELQYGIYNGNKPILLKPTPRDAYAALIDKISGKGVFQSNPFVFVYEFELID